MDKSYSLNIFNFFKNSFLIQDYKFDQILDSQIDTKKFPFFEMDYPYFSQLKNQTFCFTTDYGLVVLDLKDLY